jgi:hypothetical protein
MNCIAGVSPLPGYQCQVCRQPMQQNEVRSCSGSQPVSTVSTTSSTPEDGCCPAVQSVGPCLPTRISDCRDHGYERCVKCGYLFVPGESRQRQCTNFRSPRQPENPSFIASASRYVQAYAKWRAEGKPIVPLPQIIERFRVCSSCPLYNDVTSTCTICGCFVNLLHDGQGMNKLEWATEQCSDQPPKWNKIG